MEISEFISTMPAERQDTLTKFHAAILANDSAVTPIIKLMMGKEMILYEQRGYMKYALASTQKYMSLHCLPMYMTPALYQQFEKLLPAAKFQKGCINFNDETEMPVGGLVEVIKACSVVDIADMLEKRKKK